MRNNQMDNDYNLIEEVAYAMAKAYRETTTRLEAVARIRKEYPEVMDGFVAVCMWAAIDANEDTRVVPGLAPEKQKGA